MHWCTLDLLKFCGAKGTRTHVCDLQQLCSGGWFVGVVFDGVESVEDVFADVVVTG
jgi:hypothetical protein